MRVLVCGSRSITDYKFVEREMLKVLQPTDTVIEGGARGVDTLARRVAENHGLDVIEYPANWTRHGKSAGFRRNREMVQNCDRVLALWDGVSSGTEHTIRIARQAGVPVDVVEEDF